MDALTRAEKKRLRPDKKGNIDLSRAMPTPEDLGRWLNALSAWTPPQSISCVDLSHNNLDEDDAGNLVETLGTRIHYINLSYNQIKCVRPLLRFLCYTRTGLNLRSNELSGAVKE